MAAGQDKPDFQKTLYDLHGVLKELNLGELKHKHKDLHHALVRFQGAFSHEQGRISNQNLTTIGYTPDAQLAIRTDIPTSKPQPAWTSTVHGSTDLPDNDAKNEDDEKRKKLHAVNKKMGKDGGRRESSENAMLDLQWKYEQLQKENEDLKER